MNHHASDARGIALLPLEVKTGPKIGEDAAPGEAGTFEGYGAIFGNVDRDGDVVEPGAFAESLKARTPVLLWQHDTKAPIGRFEVVREDEKGLYVKGRLSMQGRGAEAYELLRMGALDGLSIGFITREATRDAATGTRRISKADLMEVSLVTFPANDLARTHSVKSALGGAQAPSLPDDPRAFERFLRDYGFSRTRARTITAKGFGAEGLGHADSHEITALVQELKRRKLVLEGTRQNPLALKATYTKELELTQGENGVSARRKIAIASISPLEPTTFKIKVSRRAEDEHMSPIFLRFGYTSTRQRGDVFKWQSHAHGSSSTLSVPAGAQEILVWGWTTGAPDWVKVTLY